jgi:hypothetical protein
LFPGTWYLDTVDEMHRRLYKQVPHNGVSSWGFLTHFSISDISVAFLIPEYYILEGSVWSLFCVTHFLFACWLTYCINHSWASGHPHNHWNNNRKWPMIWAR